MGQNIPRATLRLVTASVALPQEGSHTKWKHPLIPASTLILSGHDSDDAKPYQEKAVRDLLRRIAEAERSAES